MPRLFSRGSFPCHIVQCLMVTIVIACNAGCSGPHGSRLIESQDRADAPGPQRVTLATLIEELVDLDRLAYLPAPEYTCRQFSSYDRASRAPDRDWYANNDAGHFIRMESHADREERVLVDLAGPGAVVRIWSANPVGTLRVYLDQSAEPVLAVPFADLLSGKIRDFPVPIAGTRGRGANLYFPIPFAQHLKITCDAGDFYYHVGVRCYAPGAAVDSYSRAQHEALRSRIQRIAAALYDPVDAIHFPPQSKLKKHRLTLAAGNTTEIGRYDGPRAIGHLAVRVLSDNLERVARGVVLTMEADGERTIECPLGDYFAAEPTLAKYAAIASGVARIGAPELWSRWRLPFERDARLALTNFGAEPVELEVSIVDAPFEWTERSLHFHASWRRDPELPSRPFVDWNHLDCQGDGRFVGGQLQIYNPVRAWWGEGDEKIYVDGESFPSTFGTGTEDYYGYAWCSPELFSHAYHNQTRCDGPDNYGYTAVSRFHILDDIPFRSSLRFDIENWHWHDNCATDRAAVSFWYARPGATVKSTSIVAADLAPRALKPYQPIRVEHALEGEELQVLAKTGEVHVQNLGERYSNSAQLWWTLAKPGDRLEVGFDGGSGGVRRIFARLTRAPDYGVVRFSINGVAIGEPVDLYRAGGFAPSEEIELGRADLERGENRLTIEIVGANPSAHDGFMFGIDYLRVATD